ncbi:MAG: hypothetical protein JRN34_00425 [Nitrososphaerota archaeon]|jgi:hypothetical protein|nr:hypothetical protein [Nitrososphaerota archaeon]MDG6943129.1 hypothetical protein [Nitrososphaerota archaeon]MDG6950993.1 hypothetical protein [Nitrososphaerota archaeon]
MGGREKGVAAIVGLLALTLSGRMTVSLGEGPMITIDADSRVIDLEASGIEEAGIHLSDFIRLRQGPRGAFEESVQMIGTLSRLGWKLNLYAHGDRVLSAGSGVSRLTGRINVNPLELRKLRELIEAKR